MHEQYDFCIVGTGSAGTAAVEFADRVGAKIALVEKGRIGGDSTWYGSIPSRALARAAKTAHMVRNAGKFGIETEEPKISFDRVMNRVRALVFEIYSQTSPEIYQQKGIDVFSGTPEFEDAHSLKVNGHTVTARRFLICTGASPKIPEISGLEQVSYQTYQTIWDIDKLPEHLLVIGGGQIGVEMAQTFRRLGSKVTIITDSSRILPDAEPETSRVIHETLVNEGVQIRTGSIVSRAVEEEDENITLEVGGKRYSGDVLLIATGRKANVEGLKMENAGVAYDENGIYVDSHLRTTQRNIFACGDCIGREQYSHYAKWQAVVATRNALFPGASRGIIEHVPWTVFTDPEVAHVGMTEEEAREKYGRDICVHNRPMSLDDRGRIDGDVSGHLKVIHKNGKVLGVEIVSMRAGEAVQEWIMAIEKELKITDISTTVHIYPSYTRLTQGLTGDIALENLFKGPVGTLLKGISYADTVGKK
jgi:pyruvate/2-oxoglutarate dehydrogenase complex dihydrolipoamide dehydrogenase (E3) component